MTSSSRRSWAATEGLPFPLGATWIEDEQAWNFALYSKHAERVTLLLYSASDFVHPEVMRLRKQQIKNFCCLLFLANGTPMFRAGDEFMHTQRGNNNPYNQNNETGWLDWSRMQKHADIFYFFKAMIAFRKAHPSLARSRYWRADVRWYGVGPEPDTSWTSHSLAFLLQGDTQNDADLYVMINAYWDVLDFHIQARTAAEWRQVVDTSLEPPHDFLEPGNESALPSLHYRVAARSVVILIGSRRGVWHLGKV